MRFHVSFLPSGYIEDRATVEKAAKTAQLDPSNLRYYGNGVWELPKETSEHLDELDPATRSVIGSFDKRTVMFEDAKQWLEFVQEEHV